MVPSCDNRTLCDIEEADLARTILIFLTNISIEKGVFIPVGVLKLAFEGADKFIWARKPRLDIHFSLNGPYVREPMDKRYSEWCPTASSEIVDTPRPAKIKYLSELGMLDITQCLLRFVQEYATTNDVCFPRRVLNLAYGCVRRFEYVGVNHVNESKLFSMVAR
jgi:hypothetical protein